MYASNNGANYAKQKLVELPRKIEESPIIVEETLHSSLRSIQIQLAENQWGHSWTQQYHQSTGCNGHL